MKPVLSVRDVEVAFATSQGRARAVAGVSFDLAPGERLGLVGESGSGKTTTALALMRLIRPPGRIEAGTILLDGQDMLAADERALRRLRGARIALVPQGAMNALNPVLDIATQFDDLLDAHGEPRGRAVRRARIAALLASVRLAPEVMARFPHELSGGMRQRVCIALAIALRPAVIVADEPTSALDVIVQKQVLATLARVQREIGAALVVVGHDMGLMAGFAHRIAVMYAGRLVEEGPIAEVFARPRHPYTRALIESLPRFGPRGVFKGLPGMAPSLLAPPPGCSFHPRCPLAMPRCATEAPAETHHGAHLASCHLTAEEAAHAA
ncbi:ABC transporter ATP-binding protein [Falsiroseomonas sp. HW251]|uniref:ABC transporter ATP-binding protein n=1 Tax=Falsiroseomonas sp. HW251 TaxID=3390998 RepID=UPI003D31B7F1